MSGTLVLTAVVVLGVDAGWRQLPDGGLEYLIQIGPHELETLRVGQPILSDIPPSVRGVRSYRITVGTAELPKEGSLEPPAEPPQPPDRSVPESITAARPPTRESGFPEFPAWQPPAPFQPAPGTNPLAESPVKAAVFDQTGSAEGDGAASQESGEAPDEAPSKPWLPLTLALMAFFASFGGMLYFGWVAWDYRGQYQTLLHRVIDAGQRGLLAPGQLEIAGAEAPSSTADSQ